MGSLSVAPAAWSVAILGCVVVALAHVGSRYIARRGLIPDMPSERSNHSDATPRAGGVAIILALMAGMGGLSLLVPASALFALNLVAIVFLAFAVGLADDLLNLSAAWKFAGQFGAAALFLVLFGALESGPLPGVGISALGAAGLFLTVLWIVGLMNAYNFMDGVNGMAAACGVIALSGLAAATAFAGAPIVALAAAFAAAALLGFLPLNFPSARLFMGDSGSHGIGVGIAALAVIAAQQTAGSVSALFVPTALAPFLFDVAFTLVHRTFRRRNILSAHSEHLYQALTRLGASHAKVTAIYATLTALSTAAALFMLRVDPAWQWLVPALLMLAFLAPALPLYAAAKRAGLFAAQPQSELPLEATPASTSEVFPHAAE